MGEEYEIQRLGREFAVYDRRSGDVHMLNASAMRIWQGVRAGLDSRALLEQLYREYPDVNQEILAADVRRALTVLQEAGLIPGPTTDDQRETP